MSHLNADSHNITTITNNYTFSVIIIVTKLLDHNVLVRSVIVISVCIMMLDYN